MWACNKRIDFSYSVGLLRELPTHLLTTFGSAEGGEGEGEEEEEEENHGNEYEKITQGIMDATKTENNTNNS